MTDESWYQDSVQITDNRVTVQEANCSVVITEKGSIVKTATDGAQGANILHSKKCNEAGCAQCLFYYLDIAKRKGSEEKIGRGAQGSIYRFRAPGYQKKREYFVRKEITITPGKSSNLEPVAEMVIDETARHGVAASVEGEVNRLFRSSPHFVRLFGIRLSGTEQKTVEFVLEYMELALSDLQSHVSLIDQRILNRISTRFPPSFPGEGIQVSLTPYISAAIAILTIVGSRNGLFHYKPYFENCACNCDEHTRHDCDETILLDSSSAGTLPESVLLNIFKQITCGLQRMNQCSIIHKDVKPSNILVNRFGKVKLADFGTSKRGTKNEGITHAMSPYIMCTRIYKAPELAGIGRSMLDTRQGLLDDSSTTSTEGGSRVTSAADVWSLGLTLLVLATPHKSGPWPDEFIGVQRDCLFHPSCISDFRVPATLSTEILTFIKDCLIVDSNKRPTADQLSKHPSLPEKCSCKTGGHDRQEYSLDKFLEFVNYLTYPFYEAKRIGKTLKSLGIRMPPGRGCDRFPFNFPQEYSKWCSQSLRFIEALRQGMNVAVSKLEIPTYPTPVLRSPSSLRSLHRRSSPFLKRCHHVVMHSVAEVQQTQTEELVTVTGDHIHVLGRLLKSLRKRKDVLTEIENTPTKGGSSQSDSPRLRLPSSCSVSDSDFESLAGIHISESGDDYSDSLDQCLEDIDTDDRILRLSYRQHVQAERKQNKTTRGHTHKGSTHSNKRNYSYLSPHSTFDGVT